MYYYNPLTTWAYVMLMALTESGEREADDGAEGRPHVPAVLEGGHRVHGDPEHGDQQLTADQVHQKQVKLSPQLQRSLYDIW